MSALSKVQFKGYDLLINPGNESHLVEAYKGKFGPKIYNNWADCKKSVDGFVGAIYKKFDNIVDATKFMEEGFGNNKPKFIQKKEDYESNNQDEIDKVLNGEDKVDKYIYIENYPCDDDKINKYLLQHKKELIERGIRKFNENNWFEWGAPRNITTINNNLGKDCIYIYNLTRKSNVSFLGKVNYFGGGLLMLKPKKKCNLNNIVSYINSNEFKDNFMFSGRFKIGHRQICNSHIPIEYL